MKVFHCFLGLLFLISVSVSQSVASENITPPGLEYVIESVKEMKQAGASNKDIAAFVKTKVKHRLEFINHSSKIAVSLFGKNKELDEKVKRYGIYIDKSLQSSENFSAATWAWKNRIGQCNESAAVAFHILAMAYESTDQMKTVNIGDHRFVVLGDDIQNLPNGFSPDDLRKLDNAYIIDAWDDQSFSTKDLSRVDVHQYGNGQTQPQKKYTRYKQLYDKWLDWCKKHPDKYQKWIDGTPDTDTQIAKDKDEMNRLLAQYRKDIDALWASRDQILWTERDNKNIYDKAEANLKLATNKLSEIEKYKDAILDYVDEGKKLCDEVMDLHQKIINLSIAMEDGDVLINEKIDLAKVRAANCKTDADGIFIKNNYQAAQDAYKIMINAKDGALEAFNDIDRKLYRIKTINDNLKNIHDRYAWRDIKQECRELIEDKPNYIELLKKGLKEEKEFTKKVQALKQKIEASQTHYGLLFQSSTKKFAELVRDITNNTKIDYATAIPGLDDLLKKYQREQTALDTPRLDNPIFSGDPPLTECNTAKATKKVMDKIDETFLRGLLVLKISDYLRGGCQVKTVAQNPPKGSDDSPAHPPAVNTGGSTLPINPASTDTQADPSNTTGGLKIFGPTEITIGQRVTYTACDSKGVPYTAGSFSWNFSDDTIMSLGNKTGNSISGVGFKPGTVLLWVHYDGETVYKAKAYLDIEIKDRPHAKKLCNETKVAATDLSAKIQDNEKKFISFGNKLKKLFENFKNLKKESHLIKTAHKDLEKKAAAIAEISHEIEKSTLKICNATKELNDPAKTDSDHNRNYDLIKNKEERLKELLDSAKNIIKDANSLNTDSKKRFEAVKLLKDTSQAALRKMSQDIEILRETNFDKRMDALKKKASMISTDTCPEDVFVRLGETTKYYQKNQNKLEQIMAFYKTINTDFDKKVKAVENLGQIHQKTAYILKLSKAYVERSEKAVDKGSFCAGLAENIINKVFIPDVRGIAINNAESMVNRKGLNVTRSELGPPPSAGKAGEVENILPGITKRVKKGTMVTLSYYDERPDRESQLANANCTQWPGSQAVWDTQTDKPACGCTGDMVWNQDRTKCISRIDVALANANCQYPNSYPVWNYNLNQAMCECLPGTAWNNDKSACINSKQAALEKMDCSQYPGTIPNYDTNGNLGCACPDGLPWIQDLNRCATQRDVAMASVDCSQFPGTIPVWDAQNNKPACNCPYGTEWNPQMRKCFNKQDLAIANTDCSHLPGSVPTWSYITNQVECECQSPYSRDPMTGKCVDFAAQLLQRERNSREQSAQNQRDFEERMANKQKQDQKQLEELWHNILVQPKPSRPSNPSKDTGNTYQTQQNNCGRKISKQELASLKENYGRMVKQWSHVQGWYENFRLSVGAGRYLDKDRYQKSIDIWTKSVNCWNGCAMAAPKSGAKSVDIKRFYNCRQKCFKDFKYDNT